jgi:dGTPase
MLEPINKNVDDFIKEYEETYSNPESMYSYVSCTLEGCIVRLSDIIAYLGRDIEDGIRVGLIKKSDIPNNIKEVLGITTSDIINTIVTDIITNSLNKSFIKISEKIYKAISDLKIFNYKNIYNKANSEENLEKYKLMLETMYDKYLNDLICKNLDSIIYKSYLNNMDDTYKNNNSMERIALDYVAGMTDEYLKAQYDSLNVIEN